jgi:hypothetical protein
MNKDVGAEAKHLLLAFILKRDSATALLFIVNPTLIPY